MGQMHHHHPRGTNSIREWDWGSTTKCELTQHQTGETPLGWVNRKLHAFIQTFSGASLLDKGWKVQCGEIRGVSKSMLVFWQQRYWLHWWVSKIWPARISSTPPLFVLEFASSQYRDCEMGALAHTSVFGVTILSWIQMLWNSLCFWARGPWAIITLPNRQKKTCSTS